MIVIADAADSLHGPGMAAFWLGAAEASPDHWLNEHPELRAPVETLAEAVDRLRE